jgi:hypothetical protein
MPRKPSFGIRAASIALLSIQAAPVQAIERSKVEPIASETIDIIVSVRARYQLRAADEPRKNNGAVAGAGRFCLDSNAAPGLLPVRLLRLSGSAPGPAQAAATPAKAAAATPIARCASHDGRFNIDITPADRPRDREIMLIQPE